MLYFRWGLTAAYIFITVLLRPGQDSGWVFATVGYLVVYHLGHTVHTSIHTRRGRPVLWFFESTPFADIVAISLIMASVPSLVFPVWATYLVVVFGASVSRRGSYVVTLTVSCIAGYGAAVGGHLLAARDVSWSNVIVVVILLVFGGWFSSTRAQLELALYERLRTSEQRTGALYRLNDALVRAGALSVIYEEALESIQRTLNVHRSSVLLFDPDGVMRFKAWRGLSEGYRQAVEGHSPWSPEQRDAQPILMPDAETEPGLDALRDVVLGEGIRALAFVPLTYQGRLLGKFMVYYEAPHRFTDEEVHLLQTIASHVAYAVERKRSEETITRLAFHDALTGLPNRRLFEDRLGVALAQARRHKRPLAILSVDLDRFKLINDTFGHAAGDFLLRGVAERLSGLLREGDTIARLGGDEFLLLLPSLSCREDVVEVAERALLAFSQPFHFDGQQLRITPSIGVSFYPEDADEAETLLRAADAAMYRAKELGRNNYQMWIRPVPTRGDL